MNNNLNTKTDILNFLEHYVSTTNPLFISLVLWTTVILCFAGSQTIFYANFKPSKTTRPRRFLKLIISALPATVLIVCTGYLFPKDASLNYFGSLHALSSLNNLLIFLIFYHTRQPLRSLHSGLQLHQPVSSGLFTSRSFSH